MKRREFITLLGGAAVAWPLAARAQQTDRIRRIGALMAYAESDPEGQVHVAAFRDELQKLGWAEGRNIRIDSRWAMPGDAESRQRFAKELVALQPDLILSHSTPNTATLLQQTRTIPIIFAQVADPVASGFVASFARPGGNVTGFIVLEGAMAGKWLELLKEIAPGVNRVAVLFNPATAPFAEIYLNPFKAAAASFGVEVIAARVHDMSELESVVAAQAREPAGGLIAMPDSFLTAHRAEITSLAARYRLPAVYPYRFYTEHGGLLSYGVDLVDNYRRAATYADRILKGDKPSELPVQAPVKFELVVNLKTAKTLGLDVPWILQQRADPRRRSRMAARGAGAAAQVSSDRFPFALRSSLSGRIRRRIASTRLHRGPKYRHRVPICAGKTMLVWRTGQGISCIECGCHRCDQRLRHKRGYERNAHHTHRHGDSGRPDCRGRLARLRRAVPGRGLDFGNRVTYAEALADRVPKQAREVPQRLSPPRGYPMAIYQSMQRVRFSSADGYKKFQTLFADVRRHLKPLPGFLHLTWWVHPDDPTWFNEVSFWTSKEALEDWHMSIYHKHAKAWAAQGAIMEDIITNFELKNTRLLRVCPCCGHVQDKTFELNREQETLAEPCPTCQFHFPVMPETTNSTAVFKDTAEIPAALKDAAE